METTTAPAKNLGHNGPYFGSVDPIEQDCRKIPGHSDLFRSLEGFETDLTVAAERLAGTAEALRIEQLTFETMGANSDNVTDVAVAALRQAAQYLADARLVADVLDDRTMQRQRVQRAEAFEALIADTPREAMSPTERLTEEARLTSQISQLLDRMAVVRGMDCRAAWPGIDPVRIEELRDELDRAGDGPTAEALKRMAPGALVDALRDLEQRSHTIKRKIGLIHALRQVASS